MAARRYCTYTSDTSQFASWQRASIRSSARAVNTIMTATYWEVGRRIVEFEQGGERRDEYGETLIKKLAVDLTAQWVEALERRSISAKCESFS